MSSYVLFILCWITLGLGAGLYLFRREAPYGRFASDRWGPTISNRWGWILMEVAVMIAFAVWVPLDWLWSPFFLAGTALFITGMVINWRSDYTLIHLRSKGEKDYKIPASGLFNYVSSPNLLG